MILTTYNKKLHEKTLRREGRDAINQLNALLLKEQRYEELERSTKDPEYQEKLLKEYGIAEDKNPVSDRRIKCKLLSPAPDTCLYSGR